MKIGLIGEDPNDTQAIKNLLQQKLDVKFKPLLKNITGSNLDSKKFLRMFRGELKKEEFSAIFFVRDLDGLPSENQKIEKKKYWFNKLKKENPSYSFFLLNIYEIEALVLSDINTFNKLFGCDLKESKNPMYVKNPKELLKSETKQKFKENLNPKVFYNLNFDVVKNNCDYFSDFYNVICEFIYNGEIIKIEPVN